MGLDLPGPPTAGATPGPGVSLPGPAEKGQPGERLGGPGGGQAPLTSGPGLQGRAGLAVKPCRSLRGGGLGPSETQGVRVLAGPWPLGPWKVRLAGRSSLWGLVTKGRGLGLRQGPP